VLAKALALGTAPPVPAPACYNRAPVRKVLHVVGARPNFMKIAPVIRALAGASGIRQVLVHTGQHYDERMAHIFLQELEIPRPDRNLEVGSGSQAEQTAAILTRFEKVVEEERPDLVVVVGDVNSTLAATLVAAKAGAPVAHVEAGLRSFDLSMPEEINRMVTDRLSSLLLTPSRDADENLAREGVPAERVHFVGNVMIDTLLRERGRAPWDAVRARLGVEERSFALLTLHRPSNVDDPAALARILERLQPVAGRFPILFPIHPRTHRRISENGLEPASRFLRCIEPLGYREFLALMDHAALVLTDSGGIQEETTVLGVPCFTLRDNTERPITVEEGTNSLVGADGRGLPTALADFENTGGKRGRIPEKWDGAAGTRVAAVIEHFLGL
jgi:UDP-N-acetylglucosamine 2-epimerase (non-hydrolysing)